MFLTVTEVMCFCEIKTTFFDIQYSVNESRVTMGQDGSGSEFHVNFGSGSVTLVVGRVGSGQKIGTASNSRSRPCV